MIHQIANTVYKAIREYGGLSREDVAVAVGRKAQVVRRWESDKQKLLPKREQEEILVKEAKVTRVVFVEIMCEVLTNFAGQRVTMAPSDQYYPSLPLSRASKLYSRERDRLTPEEQAIVVELLQNGRSLDAIVDQACTCTERQIVRTIKQALASRGHAKTTDPPRPSSLYRRRSEE